MTNLFAIVLSSLSYLFAGFPYAKLAKEKYLVGRFGLAYLLGCGLVTWVWFLFFRLGIPFTIQSFLTATTVIYLLGTVLGRFFPQPIRPKSLDIKSLPKPYFYLLMIAGVGLLVHLMITSYDPITAWDSITMYDFRGRIIALNHDLTDIINSAYHLSYPLMISLFHASVYIMGGVNAQALHTLLIIAFLGVIFSHLSAWTNIKLATITTLLIMYSYDFFYLGSYAYTNVPYTIFLLTSIVYTISPNNQKTGQAELILAGLILGIAYWTRSAEPFWILALPLILWEGVRRKIYLSALFSIGVFFLLRQSWVSYSSPLLSKLLPSSAESVFTHFTLDNLRYIFTIKSSLYWYLRLNVIDPYTKYWLLLLLNIIASVIIRKRRQLQLTLFGIFAFSLAVGGTIIFSTFYTTWAEIGDSARRMMLFIVPLSLITSAYAYSVLKENK